MQPSLTGQQQTSVTPCDAIIIGSGQAGVPLSTTAPSHGGTGENGGTCRQERAKDRGRARHF